MHHIFTATNTTTAAAVATTAVAREQQNVAYRSFSMCVCSGFL